MTELRALLSSSCGRSEATAIIIPNTVETAARTPRPTRSRSSRSLRMRTRRRGGLGPSGLPCGRSATTVAPLPAPLPCPASGPVLVRSLSLIDRCHLPDPPRAARGPSWARAGADQRPRGRLALGRMEVSASEAARTAAQLARNAVESLPAGALADRLATGRPLRAKLGLDPTAPDLHLGHTVVLQKLREFQDLGHTVVLIVGDYTARVGDPSCRSATRAVLSRDEIDANARTYLDQASKVLRTDDTLEVRLNSEWLDMPMEDLFRLVRVPTVAQLLERDDFAKRMAASEPVSLLELLYPVLQGYDSVAIEADVELGGTDQTFNLFMGRALQQTFGQKPQVVLTMPLLTGLDGEQKMSKSYGNVIGISEPPGEMYGKTLSIPAALLESWYGLLLGRPIPADVGPRDAKRALARALVARFWGDNEAVAAEAGFDRVHIAHDVPEDVEELVLSANGELLHLPEVIVSAFGGSRSDARRMLAQGGVKLDGEPVPADPLDVPAATLDGRVLQVGKRKFRRLRIA